MIRWSWMRQACVLGVMLPALAMPLAGHAQVDSREGIALQNQIYQLKQQLDLLRSDVARGGGGYSSGGGGGNDAAAELLSRVQAMEEAMRQLRGRIDEIQNLIDRQNADLSKRLDDLTFQLNLGKGGAPAASAQTATPPPVREVAPRPQGAPPNLSATQGPLPAVISPPRQAQNYSFNQVPEPMRGSQPPPARIEPARPVPRPDDSSQDSDDEPPPPSQLATSQVPLAAKRTPELALQEGHAALARRDYAAAERSAREVMANRASPRAYDGQFLLAQALAGQKQYAQAAIAYDDTYNRSRKGRHAEDALVGLAGALTAINEKKAACETLGKLRTEFPEVRADLRDNITRTNDRAGCGR